MNRVELTANLIAVKGDRTERLTITQWLAKLHEGDADEGAIWETVEKVIADKTELDLDQYDDLEDLIVEGQLSPEDVAEIYNTAIGIVDGITTFCENWCGYTNALQDHSGRGDHADAQPSSTEIRARRMVSDAWEERQRRLRDPEGHYGDGIPAPK